MPDVARLTDRQRECLRLVYWRFQIKEIADRLGISPSAVKDHLEAARERLGNAPTSMAAARLLAEAEGLTDRPSGTPPPKPLPPPPAAPPGALPDREQTHDGLRLASAATPAAYEARTLIDRLPLPTEGRRSNDLTWREKLFWGLAIAILAVVLLGSMKALLL